MMDDIKDVHELRRRSADLSMRIVEEVNRYTQEQGKLDVRVLTYAYALSFKAGLAAFIHFSDMPDSEKTYMLKLLYAGFFETATTTVTAECDCVKCTRWRHHSNDELVMDEEMLH